MTNEQIFSIVNNFALVGWVLLVFAPRWRWTQRIVHGAVIPLLLTPVYIKFLVSGSGGDGNFTSLSGVMKLFESPEAVIAGWIHYLAFDLFIGAWESRDARRLRIPHWAVVPCMFFTLMLGPVGLMMYLLMRIVMRRRWIIDETETCAPPPRRAEVPVVVEGKLCKLRRWQRGDELDLIEFANNAKIWRNLDDRFPHPYTPRDAAEWTALCEGEDDPPRIFAIEVDGRAVGGIGLIIREGISRKCAEVGYWLAESHWSRGIATEAVQMFSDYAFEKFDLLRLQAGVFAWNPASARVLEKAGYHREGTMTHGAFKDMQPVDLILYARVKN